MDKYFVLVRGNKPIAELRPLPAGKRLAELPALLASLPHLSTTEAAQLAEDLMAAREALARGGGPRSVAVLIDASILIEHERERLDLERHLVQRQQEEFLLSVPTA